MKIKVIQYNGIEEIYDVDFFEFKTNHVSNWIRLKLTNGNEITVHNVCVIKTM